MTILEFSGGDVIEHPEETSICALCNEIGAFKKCTCCEQVLYCDQKCELLHFPEHDFCNRFQEIQEELEKSQELEEMMGKEFEINPDDKWTYVVLVIIFYIFILTSHIDIFKYIYNYIDRYILYNVHLYNN